MLDKLISLIQCNYQQGKTRKIDVGPFRKFRTGSDKDAFCHRSCSFWWFTEPWEPSQRKEIAYIEDCATMAPTRELGLCQWPGSTITVRRLESTSARQDQIDVASRPQQQPKSGRWRGLGWSSLIYLSRERAQSTRRHGSRDLIKTWKSNNGFPVN